MLRLTAAAAIAVLLMSGCSTGPAQDSPALTIGAIYPLSGPQAKGGSEEFAGLRAALEVAVHAKVRAARLIHLRVIDVQTPEQAVAAVDRLAAGRVPVIVG
ncbi:MAG: hypothetical protein M3Z13_04620, partial [Candidatus Dormibacteraeota bacterium]|nr:hypothetical protein [Candidatus Dormibacteraeota bacterium]